MERGYFRNGRGSRRMRTLLAAAQIVFCSMAAAVPESDPPPAHPRLFFNASDIPAMRLRTAEAAHADPFNEIKIDCRSTYGPGKPIPNANRKRNAQALLAHGALLILDPDLAATDTFQSDERFHLYYDAVLDYAGWSNFFGNDPFDTSVFLVALATGYDWHRGRFSDNKKASIVSKLAARADYMVANQSALLIDVPANLNDPETGYLHLFKVQRNRSLIPASALAFLAVALEGEVDEARRQTWLAVSNAFMSAWESKASPDGWRFEGYSYHEFAIQTLFMTLEAQTRAAGVNRFAAIPYVANHPLYSIYSWVPGGDRSFGLCNPLGDTVTAPPGEMRSNVAVAARRLREADPVSAELGAWMRFRALGGPANNNYYRDDPMHFMWAGEQAPMKSPAELNLPLFRFFPNQEAFVWRSGWDDGATYFSFLCGPQIGGHQLPELGNFILYKGGAPYIGHHGDTSLRRTEYGNVLMANGLGQLGDNSALAGTTDPIPQANWGRVEALAAGDSLFLARVNPEPVYRESKLQEYTREFLGWNGRYFVRDRMRVSTGNTANYQLYLHAYKTSPISPAPNAAGSDFAVLDIDSNRTGNPWSGSGRNWTLTPRTTGPVTSVMTVQDLSAATWTPAVTASVVNESGEGDIQRGFKMVRSHTARTATSLMAFSFPGAGETLSAWPDAAAGDGFILTGPGGLEALALWSDAGAADSQGLAFDGFMAGAAPPRGWVWGRGVTRVALGGETLMTSTAPVSFWSDLRKASGNQCRIQADAPVRAAFRHDQPVSAVRLNGAALASAAWSWAGGTLTADLPATGYNALLETTVGSAVTPAMVADYLTGRTDNPAGLDLTGDGAVDIADLIASLAAG